MNASDDSPYPYSDDWMPKHFGPVYSVDAKRLVGDFSEVRILTLIDLYDHSSTTLRLAPDNDSDVDGLVALLRRWGWKIRYKGEMK